MSKCFDFSIDTITCSDCSEYLVSLHEQKGEIIDFVITSTPYAQQRSDTYGGISEKDFPEWMLMRTREIMKVMKPHGSFIFNIKEHVNKGARSLYVLETILLLSREFIYVDEFIWNKTNPFPTGSKKRLKDGFERCFHFAKTPSYQFFPNNILTKSTSKYAGMNERRKNKGAHNVTNGSGMNMSKRITGELVRPSNVITLPASSLNIGHPAVYPVGLPEFFIKLMTKEGDIVLDPFMGSGTTAIASYRNNRHYIGIDQKREYVDLANKRLESLKGDKNV